MLSIASRDNFTPALARILSKSEGVMIMSSSACDCSTFFYREQKVKQKYFEKYHFKVLKPVSYGVENGDTIQLNKN